MPADSVTDATQHVRERLIGVMVTTVTPFNADYSFDWNGVNENLDFLIAEGVNAVIPCGSLGEYPLMEVAEREELVARTVDHVAGRTLVIAGTADENSSIALRLTQAARQAGADAVMVKSPHYYDLSDDELHAFYAAIDAVGVPFVVYNDPRAKGDLSLDDLEYLCGLPHFAGLKEASTDIVRLNRIVWRFGSRFPVVAGAEDSVFAALLTGATGSMTATAAFSPALLRAMYDAVQASDLPRARELQARLWSFRELLKSRAATRPVVPLLYTKAALDLLGLPGGPPRPPLQPLGDAERKALAAVLHDDMRLGPRGALLDDVAV